MVDTGDLKSPAYNIGVPVQVRSPAIKKKKTSVRKSFFVQEGDKDLKRVSAEQERGIADRISAAANEGAWKEPTRRQQRNF